MHCTWILIHGCCMHAYELHLSKTQTGFRSLHLISLSHFYIFSHASPYYSVFCLFEDGGSSDCREDAPPLSWFSSTVEEGCAAVSSIALFKC